MSIDYHPIWLHAPPISTSVSVLTGLCPALLFSFLFLCMGLYLLFSNLTPSSPWLFELFSTSGPSLLTMTTFDSHMPPCLYRHYNTGGSCCLISLVDYSSSVSRPHQNILSCIVRILSADHYLLICLETAVTHLVLHCKDFIKGSISHLKQLVQRLFGIHGFAASQGHQAVQLVTGAPVDTVHEIAISRTPAYVVEAFVDVVIIAIHVLARRIGRLHTPALLDIV